MKWLIIVALVIYAGLNFDDVFTQYKSVSDKHTAHVTEIISYENSDATDDFDWLKPTDDDMH